MPLEIHHPQIGAGLIENNNRLGASTLIQLLAQCQGMLREVSRAIGFGVSKGEANPSHRDAALFVSHVEETLEGLLSVDSTALIKSSGLVRSAAFSAIGISVRAVVHCTNARLDLLCTDEFRRWLLAEADRQYRDVVKNVDDEDEVMLGYFTRLSKPGVPITLTAEEREDMLSYMVALISQHAVMYSILQPPYIVIFGDLEGHNRLLDAAQAGN